MVDPTQCLGLLPWIRLMDTKTLAWLTHISTVIEYDMYGPQHIPVLWNLAGTLSFFFHFFSSQLTVIEYDMYGPQHIPVLWNLAGTLSFFFPFFFHLNLMGVALSSIWGVFSPQRPPFGGTQIQFIFYLVLQSGVLIHAAEGFWSIVSGNALVPQPILTQCQLDLWNKLLWNLNQNRTIFIQQNVFEYVVCKMVAISVPMY